MKQFCSSCGTRVENGAAACPICETLQKPASEALRPREACPACAAHSDVGARYCQDCGQPLRKDVRAPSNGSDRTLINATNLIRRKHQLDRVLRPHRALRQALSTMFHRGMIASTTISYRGPMVAALSAIVLVIVLLFVAVFIAFVAIALWPITIVIVALYTIAWIYARRGYANAYAQLNTSLGIGGLIESLLHGVPADQKTASDALVLLSPDSLPALNHVLLEGRDPDRQEAARTLVKIGDPAVPALIDALSDARETVCLEALFALGQIQDSLAIGPIAKLLGDTEPRIRRTAAELLGKFGDVDAVEPLIQTFDGDDEQLKMIAAHALGNLEDERAVYSLTQLQEDKNPRVRRAAGDALSRLGIPPIESTYEGNSAS